MRHFRLSALLALCVFLLAGCGGSDSSGGPVPMPLPSPAANQFAGLYKGSTSYRDSRPGVGIATIPVQIRVADDGTVQFTVMSFGGTSTATGSVDANGILAASYPNNSTTRIIGRFYREGTGFAITGNIANNPFGAKRE